MAEGSMEGVKKEPRESPIREKAGAPPSHLLLRPSRSIAPSTRSQASSPRRSTRRDNVEGKHGDEKKEKSSRGRSSSRRRVSRSRTPHRSVKRGIQQRQYWQPGIRHRTGWENRYRDVCYQRDQCLSTINRQHEEIKNRGRDLDDLIETQEEMKEKFEALKDNHALRGTVLEQYREKIESLERDVEHHERVKNHLTDKVRELQEEKKTQNDEVKTLKDTIKVLKKEKEELQETEKKKEELHAEDIDAANEIKVLKEKKEELQERFDALQAEMVHLKEKHQAEKHANGMLREAIVKFEDKFRAEMENDNLSDSRPPMKRHHNSYKKRESEGEKAGKSSKQRASSRSTSRKRSISRPQEADNTSDRRDKFKRLVGHEAEAAWKTTR